MAGSSILGIPSSPAGGQPLAELLELARLLANPDAAAARLAEINAAQAEASAAIEQMRQMERGLAAGKRQLAEERAAVDAARVEVERRTEALGHELDARERELERREAAANAAVAGAGAAKAAAEEARLSYVARLNQLASLETGGA